LTLARLRLKEVDAVLALIGGRLDWVEGEQEQGYTLFGI